MRRSDGPPPKAEQRPAKVRSPGRFHPCRPVPLSVFPSFFFCLHCKMARITVEDCLRKIPNRFEMVLCAAYRARLITQGHAPKIDAKDKPTVIALREIAQGLTGREMLERVS